MADRKPEKKEKQSSEQPVPFSDGHRNLLTVAVVGGLMLIEGVGIFVAVKYMGGGPASLSAGQAGGDGAELSGDFDGVVPSTLRLKMVFRFAEGDAG